eukprot:jgi/Botrbrau1/20835/Bobra.0156s0060.1
MDPGIGDGDQLIQGARQKLLALAQQENLSDPIIDQMASWRITARAGNHYIFHLPDDSQVQSKGAVLDWIRRNKAWVRDIERSKKRKAREKGDSDSGEQSTGLQGHSSLRVGVRMLSPIGEGQLLGADRGGVRRSGRALSQPKPTYLSSMGYGSDPKLQQLLETPQGPGRSNLAEETPGGKLPLLINVLDEETRRQAAAATSVLLQIVGLIKDFMASDVWQQITDVQKIKVERYISAITYLERNEDARREQLTVMKALSNRRGGEQANHLFVSFLCNSLDHMELSHLKRAN